MKGMVLTLVALVIGAAGAPAQQLGRSRCHSDAACTLWNELRPVALKD